MKKLSDIQGNNPFKLPDNYFEEVNRKILSATIGNKSEIKRVSLYSRFRPYLAIAASVTGFLVLSYFTVKLITVKTRNISISEVVSSESPELYINEIDLLSLEENIASSETDDVISGVSNTEIIDYLISENIELNDIYEHL